MYCLNTRKLACASVEIGRSGHHLVHVSFVSQGGILEYQRRILKQTFTSFSSQLCMSLEIRNFDQQRSFAT